MSQAERAFFTTTGFSSPNVSSQYDKATHINFHRSLSSQNPQQHLLIAISTQTLHFYHHSTSSGRNPCNMCVQVLIRQSRGNQTVRAATRSQSKNAVPHLLQVDIQTSTHTMLIPRSFSWRNKSSKWATTHQLQTTLAICILARGYHGNS